MTGAGANAPVAVTMGEPAGIGGEITLKAWQGRRHLPSFFTIDDPDRLRSLAENLAIEIPVVGIDSPREANACFESALPVLPLVLKHGVVPGSPDRANGIAVIESIDRAVELACSGAASAMVTNPIHKAVLCATGFRHVGHTGYLGEKAGIEDPVMLLCSPLLKVVPVSVHQPLIEAIATLTVEKISHAARQTAAALRQDFGIADPRLAIAGLNPHAGEYGVIGSEERDVIAPAVDALSQEGISVFGPCPADTMFHEAARANYDAAICMYHDQALIPLKTLGFDDGVNVTLGLPFVRTSPDHGTALDIAGTGLAREASLIAAIKLAAKIAARRQLP